MLVRREKYNIFAWIIALAICVSYLGVCGLYNPNVRNYSAHSAASLGGSRGIEAGNNDMLMADSVTGLTVQTRNLRSGNSGEYLEDSWMLAAVLAALLQSIILCVCTLAGRYIETMYSRRWILLEYIHKNDGKKRLGYADEGYLRCGESVL